MKEKPELYAIVEQAEDDGLHYFNLLIGKDIPEHSSHGAAISAGRFNSAQEAVDYAIGRGVTTGRITVEAVDA